MSISVDLEKMRQMKDISSVHDYIDQLALQEKAAEKIITVAINEYREDEEDFKVLSDRDSTVEEKSSARTRRCHAFLEMYNKLGESYELKKLLLRITACNETNLIRAQVISDLRRVIRQSEELVNGNVALNDFVNNNKDNLLLSLDTLRTLGRNALPIGMGIVAYDGRLCTVNKVTRNYDCARYGHQIVLTDIRSGERFTVPHSIDHQHVRYQHVYYDRKGRVACDAYGKGGTFTWKTGCKLLVKKGVYTDVADCKEKVVKQNRMYPAKHPKLALCHMLLREGEVYSS